MKKTDLKKKIENCKRNILIVGHSAREYALAKRLREYDEIENIYVASGNEAMKEFATCLDIRENDVSELLNFAMENDIFYTVATSESAIAADIASVFANNTQMIFAPSKEAAQMSLSKAFGKKLMYRLRIPTARFGIFDKLNMALDYAKKSTMPIVVKTDEFSQNDGRLVCPNYNISKSFIEDCFMKGEKKVVIEEFVYGHEFSFYVVSDGYKVLPLTSVANYKFALDGDMGAMTKGVGSYCPDYKVGFELEAYLMNEFMLPMINYLSGNGTPYVGVLGLDAVLTADNIVVGLEYNTFLQDHDCQGVLSLIDEDLHRLITACVVGSFADDYEQINVSEAFNVSCVVNSRKKDVVIAGLDELDEGTFVSHFNTKRNRYLEYETAGDRTLLLSRKGRTLNSARKLLYEELDLIKFDGKSYRTDICQN